MHARISLLIFLFSLGFLSPIFSQTKESFKVELRFSIDSRFGAVKGILKKASLMIKDRNAGTGTVEVNVSSLDTGNSVRDNHLRNEDFFEVEKFPKAEFEILKLEDFGQNVVKGKGKLTIKGITKEYEFQASITNTDENEKYSGSLKINRKDFGINYDSIVNPISEIINLEFTITLPLKK